MKRLVLQLPTAWQPYAELMRLDRPAGFYAFYVTYLIGLAYAANLTAYPPPPKHLLSLAALFLVGNVILRGVSCAWNDNIDQKFDRQVERTRNRPIARGAVSTTQGHVFTAVLTIVGAPLFLGLPSPCSWHALPILALFAFYPFAKRITHYPQFVLGFPFAWAIPLCCAALEVEPFGNGAVGATASLIAANVVWTMIYDTVYAHQDLKDDVKAGVKSMAVKFADSTKLLLSVLSLVQVSLLTATGRLVQLPPIYFVIACGGTALSLASMLVRVDLKQPSSCAWWFHYGFWFVGGSIIGGLLGAYVQKLVELDILSSSSSSILDGWI